MISLAFPNMFKSTRTLTFENKEATLSNIKLLLLSWKNSLLGDPYFGSNLNKFIYDPNNYTLKDLIIDEIYTTLIEFIPQIYLERKDIVINSERTTVTASIKCINKINSEVDLYEIDLMTESL